MNDTDGLHIYRYQLSYAENEQKGQMGLLECLVNLLN